MMKLCLYMTVLMAAVCMQPTAHAYTGECLMPGGTPNILTADLGEFNITNTSSNKPGQIVTKDKVFVTDGIPYKAKCDIDKNTETPVYLTTKVPLPELTDGWYQLNDYLSVKSQTYISGKRDEYLGNPMISESNNYNEKNGNETNWVTGSKGKISVRIDRPFVGMSFFNKEIIEIYGNALKNGVSQTPLVIVYITGKIIVPQSCELDAGQTITMDFGNISATAFTQAGVGNRPAGVNPKTHNIAIKCKNIDAQAMLSLRVEANKTSGNAIVSDNPDLGFVIADGKQNPLTPNTIDSKIPFRLDENASATVPISAWPVSVTGNKPAEGKFTSEGYLRVDFD